MNKKALYSILSTVVAMIILSVSLVLAIGPKVSASIYDNVIDVGKRYLNIENRIVKGFNSTGVNYINTQVQGIGVVYLQTFTNDNCNSIDDYAFACTVSTANDIKSANYAIGFLSLNGIVTVGNGAFYGCQYLRSVNFGDSVKTIGDSAFDACERLLYVRFAQNSQITDIGARAFARCEYLTSVTIPASVTNLGTGIFDGCNSLTEIIVENPDLMDSPALSTYKARGIVHYSQNTVMFNSNGGSAVASQTVDYNTIISSPITTRTGYTFKGWYNGDEVYDFTTPVTEDITLTAQWEENPRVTFMVDDAQYSSENVEYNTTVSVPIVPTKDGYVFKGWYTDAECTTVYDFDTTVSDDMTLYAKWEAVQTQPEPEPETPAEENAEVNNQNNNALIWGIAGTAAGILIIGGIVFGIVIAKRRRK